MQSSTVCFQLVASLLTCYGHPPTIPFMLVYWDLVTHLSFGHSFPFVGFRVRVRHHNAKKKKFNQPVTL